jgi:hypothetical protein
MADRFPLFTTIAIVDLGIVPAISQATTEATLFLTADAGRMEIPMPESTRDMSVGVGPALRDEFRYRAHPLSFQQLGSARGGLHFC